MHDPYQLPSDLPVPKDDGACKHVQGMDMPSIKLLSTGGRWINLKDVAQKRAVFFFYPRSGVPGKDAPAGWDAIPGARGCTPQSCAFKEHFTELTSLGAQVFGVSCQDTAYQKAFVERNQFPFEILSDEKFELTKALRLPTFECEGEQLIKRVTLIVKKSRIAKVFYPVFPPDKNAAEVAAWLQRG